MYWPTHVLGTGLREMSSTVLAFTPATRCPVLLLKTSGTEKRVVEYQALGDVVLVNDPLKESEDLLNDRLLISDLDKYAQFFFLFVRVSFFVHISAGDVRH